MLEDLREDVYDTLMKLPKNDLVKGTSGNVSGREDDRVVIKPSGVKYSELSPSNLVIVDLDGNVVEGDLKPSVDTGAHLNIYRQVEGIRGIIHTHSTYATAFAVLGRDVPVYTTEQADLFGGSIPVSDYVPPGSEEIGEEFKKRTEEGKFRGLLMKNHGVFTAGDTPKHALKAALLIEHSAKISYLAEGSGNPEELTLEETERLHEGYLKGYGQDGD